MRIGATALACSLLLAACGSADEQAGVSRSSADLKTFDVTEAAPPPPAAPPAPPPPPGTQPAPAPVPAAVPRIAYVYSFSFRLPGERIAQVMEAHIAACDRLGAVSCRILDMRREAGEGSYVTGTLRLQVAAPLARWFGARLGAPVGAAGGALSASGIAAEDLSKQMIDTEARISAKEAVIARLTEILRTRTGNVAQLIEAERAIAQAQEELDAARGWLVEARGRVAMSTFEIGYQSGAPAAGGFWAPIRDAAGSLGLLLGGSVAALLLFVGTALPWALLAGLAFWAFRAVRRRLRRRRPGPDA